MADAQLINNVIIDTDVGVDDTFCMANFLTLHRKKRCKVLGEDKHLSPFYRDPFTVSRLHFSFYVVTTFTYSDSITFQQDTK